MVFGLRTKVKCPKCKKTFEYVFIPGGSLTSMRLGRYRYMQCMRCKKFSNFDILTNLNPHIKKQLPIAQSINGIALLVLGTLAYLLSQKYQSVPNAFLSFRLISIISIILGVIILIGLYVYLEKKE